MTKMHVALVVGLVGVNPVHGATQGLQGGTQGRQDPGISQPRAEPPASPGLAAPTKDPFSGIFAAPEVPRRLPQLIRPTEKPARVVCGMVVVPADPNLDPKMVLDLPRKPNVEYKMRVVTPQVCRE